MGFLSGSTAVITHLSGTAETARVVLKYCGSFTPKSGDSLAPLHFCELELH